MSVTMRIVLLSELKAWIISYNFRLDNVNRDKKLSELHCSLFHFDTGLIK